MRTAPVRPQLHLFVCANRRAADDPLGPGCSAHGDAVYGALKNEVARRGIHREVWITKTHCLGICPKQGATLASYPAGHIVIDVQAADAVGVLERESRGRP